MPALQTAERSSLLCHVNLCSLTGMPTPQINQSFRSFFVVFFGTRVQACESVRFFRWIPATEFRPVGPDGRVPPG